MLAKLTMRALCGVDAHKATGCPCLDSAAAEVQHEPHGGAMLPQAPAEQRQAMFRCAQKLKHNAALLHLADLRVQQANQGVRWVTHAQLEVVNQRC